MKIFKFGGASVKDAQGVRNLADTILCFGSKKMVVVVSAMGKTTDKLEKLVKVSYSGGDYHSILNEVKQYHRNVASELLGELPERYLTFEKSLEKSLEGLHECELMFAYDQVLPYGELMSTSIVEAFVSRHVDTEWFDARLAIRTDQYFTEANVDWVITEKQVINLLKPIAEQNVVITQGFIGSDVEGNFTTLGREGSDYTGAILAYCLNANEFTVWKDVSGILNADPRIVEETEQYKKLSYREVTEMTYYGAQVIHPKTLKPIAQKGISLIVRSFLDKNQEGTIITSENTPKTIPCFIFKGNQLLVKAQVKNHSFMDEKNMGLILQILDVLNIKINLMQNSALTVSFCVDNKEFKLRRIKELLNRDFILSFESELNLATIKNYTPDSFNKLPWNRAVIMEQKTINNYQVLYR